MRIIYSPLILLFLLASCNSSNIDTTTANCQAYFDYDYVEHYYYDIKEEAIWKIYEVENKNTTQKVQVAVILEDTLSALKDTSVLNSLTEVGFIKKEVPASKLNDLRKIFCERKHEDAVFTTCVAFFRDILVFKRNNRIVGTAKICFDCGISIIAGTNHNTLEFGQSGDYGRLNKLLR